MRKGRGAGMKERTRNAAGERGCAQERQHGAEHPAANPERAFAMRGSEEHKKRSHGRQSRVHHGAEERECKHG